MGTWGVAELQQGRRCHGSVVKEGSSCGDHDGCHTTPRSRHVCAKGVHLTNLLTTSLSRHAWTASVCERIKEGTQTGVVTYFCKSRGHGFIQPSDYQPERGESKRSRGGSSAEHFVHVSDVESDFVPLKGDQVSFRLCPVPPKFERCQAVNVSITKMVDLPHKRWDTPETPEDLPEDSDQHPSPGDI